MNEGLEAYEVFAPQCERSVVQILVVGVDIGVVTYEARTLQCVRSVVEVLGIKVIYRSGDL